MLTELLGLKIGELVLTTFNNAFHIVAPFLLIIGSIIAFIGRKLIKILVFFAGGLIGGELAYSLTLKIFGEVLALILGIICFIGIGLLCVAFIPIIFGIALGFVAYHIIDITLGDILFAIIAGVVAFVAGIFLYNHILSLVTPIVGGALILQGLVSLGIPTLLSLIISFMIMIVGAIYQTRQLSK